MQQFMRRQGGHGMHSAGRAPQLMKCRHRAGGVAHLMVHPLVRVLIERAVDQCMDPPVKGEQAQVSCMWTQNQARRGADLAGMGVGEVPEGKDMRSPSLRSSICIGDTNPFVASAFPFGASAAQRAQEPRSRQLI